MISRPIIFINPNSTVSMTDAMVATARDMVPGGEVDGWTSHDGPPAIQGELDGRRAVPPLLALVKRASADGAGVIVIGCFDDTGLAEARSLAACPVIGIGQSAYHLAVLAGGRFSVVTTLEVSIPVLEANIRACGLSESLGRVRASGIPVLELERSPQASLRRLREEIAAVEREDEVGAVALGCAGMSGFHYELASESGLTVIDAVEAAALVARTLLDLRRPPQ